MYLRTPKRYSGRKQRHFGISLRRVLLWLVAVVLIGAGVFLYQNREDYIPHVNSAVDSLVGEANQVVSTMTAPTAVPTQDPTNNYQRAQEAWRRGSIQEAVNLYQQIGEAMPNAVDVHYRLALGLVNQGRYPAALEAAEGAVTANPYAPDSWSVRAMALLRLDRPEEALASALQALSLVSEADAAANPSLADSRARALAFQAEAYLDLGQTEQASVTANAALDVYPDSAEALQVRGLINQVVAYDNAAALADYRAAYDVAPNMPYIGIWLARLQMALEETDAAVEIYEGIIEQNPGNTLALYELGNYYRGQGGNLNEAINYLRRCVEADPDGAACYWRLGQAQWANTQPNEALASFERALEIDPSGGGGYYHYWAGQANITLGECPRAQPYLQNGYRIAQENEDFALMDALNARFQDCGLGPPAFAPAEPAAPLDEATPESTPEPFPELRSNET
jgi:tetratricopeptide (TPR) repeat protein